MRRVGVATMKVLIVSHLFPNRREPLKGVFVLEYARTLARHAAVEVLAPVPAFPLLRPYREVPAEDHQSGVLVHHPRYLALPGALFHWRWHTYYRSTLRFVRRMGLQADIAHVHWVYPDAYAVLKWAGQRGMRVVVTVHGHAAFGWFGPPGQHPLYAGALRRVHHVITVSDEIRGRLAGDFGVEASRITTIHNGVDMGQFGELEREEARRSLGLPLNKRILLAVARLSPEKQLHHLIEAVGLAREEHDLQLHLVGEGPLKAALRERIQALGLGNRVILEGGVPHDRLNDWYRAADLFCLSSAHEGCPVVVHEALACGVPVVSTAVGAVPDVLNAPGYGSLCPPGNVRELSRAISGALRRDWDRKQIAEYGRRFTWDDVVRKSMDVYHRVLAGSAPS